MKRGRIWIGVSAMQDSVPCVGQHVPGPLNHLSVGVIMALWDTTQPSNTQGALQRRHLLRKYLHGERESSWEGNVEKGGGSV